jgi:hypothetical protein
MGVPTSTNIYPYNPTTTPAIFFTTFYSILTFTHFHLSILTPHSLPLGQCKHRYTIPLFIAAMLSTAGYGLRIASIHHTDSVPLYATSASYIVVAPIFVCATLYLLLTHLIRTTLPEHNQRIFGVPARWLGRTFIFSDVSSFLMQASGSGVASSGNWEGKAHHPTHCFHRHVYIRFHAPTYVVLSLHSSVL